MIVSAIITSYNEEFYLPKLLHSLLEQSYDLGKIEVILLDSNSSDGTLSIMYTFKENNIDKFYDIKIMSNRKGSLSSGLNLGIDNASGDCILKLDSHSVITRLFIEQNVKTILSGEFICGGKRPTITIGESNLSKTLHMAEESTFGSSIANYRKSDSERYVSSIFQGMHRKEVFDNCGKFDEFLSRTEDNEFYHRARMYGYKIKYNPEIVSYQYMRETVSQILKQKYLNGYWIGLTSHVRIDCLCWYHFIPFIFILLLIFVIGMASFGIENPVVFLLSCYSIVLALVSFFSMLKYKFSCYFLLLPVFIFLIHLCYGIGTLVGMIKGIFWKKIYDRSNR